MKTFSRGFGKTSVGNDFKFFLTFIRGRSENFSKFSVNVERNSRKLEEFKKLSPRDPKKKIFQTIYFDQIQKVLFLCISDVEFCLIIY